MTLELQGRESTKVKYQARVKEGDHYTTMDRYAYGTRNLIKVSFPVDGSGMMVGNRVSAGQYRLPFEVALPASLPGSLIENYMGGQCKIEYKLKAELKGSGKLWNYSAEMDDKILAAPQAADPVPYNQQPDLKSVKFFGCFGRGSVLLGALVADTRLHKGETTSISIAVRNHTRVQLQGISGVLTQYYEWNADRQKQSTSKVIAKAGNEGLILDELSDWEKMVTQNAFEKAKK